MNETLYFKTNTLLKNLVGKDLINDDNIAIVELVKNSYDAGSEAVLVRFTQFSETEKSKESSQVIIADEGSGMDQADIEDKWLNIAYSEKKLLVQESGAYLAGNKGRHPRPYSTTGLPSLPSGPGARKHSNSLISLEDASLRRACVVSSPSPTPTRTLSA